MSHRFKFLTSRNLPRNAMLCIRGLLIRNSRNIIILLLLFTIAAKAQNSKWTEIDLKTDVVLVSIYFLDENTGWIIGRFPFHKSCIFKTVDGGESWFVQQKELPVALTSICFTDSNNGWAVAESGKIIHTTDGGKSWFLQSSTTRYNLNSVCFIDSKTGWAVGIFGRIVHTTDGGSHWQRQYSGNSINFLNSVHFLDSQIGWIVGDGGIIFKTTDGGSNWLKQPIPMNNDLNSVRFIDSNHGWIVGQDAIILSTPDGGSNWNIQDSPIMARSQGDNDLYSVYFTDINSGWAVGRDGIILNTIDGGKKWELEISGTTNNLYCVFFSNEKRGWAAGAFGTILQYESSTSIDYDKNPSQNLPGAVNLKQNYPNPFNPNTTIEFTNPKTNLVTLKIYDVLGEEVATLVSERLAAGNYSYSWDAGSLAGGVYLYRIQAGDYVEAKKMVLMK